MRRFSNPRFSWPEGLSGTKNSPSTALAASSELGPPASAPRDRVRHLSATEVDDLIAGYCAKVPVRTLKEQFNVGRTTIFMHLDRRGIPRRSAPKLTDDMVAEAAQRYQRGQSLAKIAVVFNVGHETIRRALHARGMTLRPRGRRASL
jgi:hypothetical protein